jgi:peptide/nickel transport system permease protein
MLIYILKRLAQGIVTLAIVTIMIFFVFQALGDPARRILPINSTEQQIQDYRVATGLADPLVERLGRYLKGAVVLDFGESTARGEPAINVVVTALPRSLALAALSIVIVMVAGLAIGIPAGLNQGGRLDRALQVLASLLASVPEFWSGLVLILIFAVYLGWLPTGGYGGLAYLILPSLAMSLPPIGRLVFVVREGVRSVLREPFILVARSKGLPPRLLVFTHILRAALLPIISVGGMELTRMAIGGVVVIESVFAWPGLGQLFVEAMSRFDLPLVSATLFCTTAVILVMNILIDLIYLWADPRVDLAS